MDLHGGLDTLSAAACETLVQEFGQRYPLAPCLEQDAESYARVQQAWCEQRAQWLQAEQAGMSHVRLCTAAVVTSCLARWDEGFGFLYELDVVAPEHPLWEWSLSLALFCPVIAARGWKL